MSYVTGAITWPARQSYMGIGADAASADKPGWWSTLSKTDKVGLGVGLAALVFVGALLWDRKKKSSGYAKNFPVSYDRNPLLSKASKRKLAAKKTWTEKDKKWVRKHYTAMAHWGRPISKSEQKLIKRAGGDVGSFKVSKSGALTVRRVDVLGPARKSKRGGAKSAASGKAYVARLSRRLPGLAAYAAKGECRYTPPAKYRKLGATKREHYAFAECFKYPIKMRSKAETKKHIRLAASRFGKFSKRLPPKIRSKVAARLDRAKKQNGIGKYRAR